jgi:hypothetical protein
VNLPKDPAVLGKIHVAVLQDGGHAGAKEAGIVPQRTLSFFKAQLSGRH